MNKPSAQFSKRIGARLRNTVLRDDSISPKEKGLAQMPCAIHFPN
jgi:hypothetical protein